MGNTTSSLLLNRNMFHVHQSDKKQANSSFKSTHRFWDKTSTGKNGLECHKKRQGTYCWTRHHQFPGSSRILWTKRCQETVWDDMPRKFLQSCKWLNATVKVQNSNSEFPMPGEQMTGRLWHYLPSANNTDCWWRPIWIPHFRSHFDHG